MQRVDLAMQCIQGHILSSMIPRQSQVAQTQVGQEHWYWGQNILYLLLFSSLCHGCLESVIPCM